ncbi:GDSL-type esterase/lipase family protein [Celerinatantimonas sp. YJH-8]|uniref:GDSL-type esterase/lipase family protein n=1 Tax=Celerinatantimonas sp. YJH-8 TaxID=3228714 RepID=UPI0038C18E99
MNKLDNSYLFQPEFVIPDHVNTILCFGDSNSWGYNPNNARQLEHPWPVLLQQILEQYQLKNDSQCGRTIYASLPAKGLTCGQAAFTEHTTAHTLLLMMLGTNDLCCDFALSPVQITEQLAQLVSGWPTPQLVIMAPAPMTTLSPLWYPYFAGREEDSFILANHYQQLAKQIGCGFFNVGDIATPGQDGIHLCAAGHRLLAQELAEYLLPESTPPCPNLRLSS